MNKKVENYGIKKEKEIEIMGKTIKELFDERYGIVVDEDGGVREEDLEGEEELNCQEHLTLSWKTDEK